MADKENNTNWIPTIVSIIVGIVFTVGATWYTVYTTKEEVKEAENERLTKVKENLVAIIEEHIVNKDSINLKSFERLITNRAKEEDLYLRPSIYNLLTQAEYNIESSKHLSFDKKREYANIISSLYNQVSSDTTIKFTNSRFQAEITQILNAFNETRESEGKKALSNLINQYEAELAEAQEAKLSKESIMDYLIESPSRLILIFSVYLLILGLYWYLIRIRRRRKEALSEIRHRTKMEAERIKDEIERIKSILEAENLVKEERIHLEDRLEMLFEKLSHLEEKYYRQHQL